MNRSFMLMKKESPGGCLPLPWDYIHVHVNDHSIQTSSLKRLYVKHR